MNGLKGRYDMTVKLVVGKLYRVLETETLCTEKIMPYDLSDAGYVVVYSDVAMIYLESEASGGGCANHLFLVGEQKLYIESEPTLLLEDLIEGPLL